MGYQNDEEALDQELDELTGLLRDNIQAKMDQHGKLDDLENQANDLRKWKTQHSSHGKISEDAAGLFMERAEKVSDKYWFQNMKYTFALGGFLLLIVIFFF